MAERRIQKTVTGQPTQDGAGVKLVRVLGPRTVEEFDPFLMLDAFDSTNPDDYIRGFPWHPHRGIETITYLVEGIIEHQDSLGHGGRIESGDCQWMTAGRGILHQEMPQKSPRMLGLQFWLNLPRAHKMAPPRYHGATRADIPLIERDGVAVRVIAGEYQGHKGALTPEIIPALFLDVDLAPNATWLFETDPEATVYLYILRGEAHFDEHSGPQALKRAVLFGPGEQIRVRAEEAGVRFVLGQARPLREPVAWGGPIVMNTQAELDQAFAELEAGTFIKESR